MTDRACAREPCRPVQSPLSWDLAPPMTQCAGDKRTRTRPYPRRRVRYSHTASRGRLRCLFAALQPIPCRRSSALTVFPAPCAIPPALRNAAKRGESGCASQRTSRAVLCLPIHRTLAFCRDCFVAFANPLHSARFPTGYTLMSYSRRSLDHLSTSRHWHISLAPVQAPVRYPATQPGHFRCTDKRAVHPAWFPRG